MCSRGMTLIELLIAISIIGILVGVLGFSYRGWAGKYNVEQQVYMLYADLMNARSMALNANDICFFDFPSADSYSLYLDTSDGTTSANGGDGKFEGQGVYPCPDTTQPGFPRRIRPDLALTRALGASRIKFERNGQISTMGTLCFFTDFDLDGKSDYDPDYDCIVISRTRISLGKLKKQNTNGGNCDADNCKR